ncbi:DegT/DnrJ/EryC1/StrS family aminotransferase [Pseudomonadales bacterium]|nr:DegT/DnrJ/EryC1/StrS family aminotransferase [Pseudomonadales bacterium]
MSKQIPFFNYKGLFAEHADEFSQTFNDVCARGAFIMQSDLDDFEKNLAKFLGCKYVIGVADGTAALVFALKASGVKAGDEVIVSSHTFVATAAAVKHVGADPVICDCLADSTMCPESAAKMITNKTSAIMPTQLNGRTADMDKLCEIAEKHNLAIVEDSCQALGAKFGGVNAGLFGMVGSYSFYPSKTLGCFGDGGAIATNDEDARNLILELRDHGRGHDGKVKQWGHNGRLDNLQAAILNVKLKYYPSMIERRRDIAARYWNNLGELTELTLPPGPLEAGKHYDIYQNFEIRATRRDELRTYLADAGIGTILQWSGWMMHHFEELKLRNDAPRCEDLSQQFMMLPMNHLLKDDEVDYICESIVRFYKGSK